MKFRSTHAFFVVAVALVAIGPGVPQLMAGTEGGEVPSVDWYSINGGSASTSVGGEYQVRGSIGQPVIGFSDGGEYELSAGFWHVRSTCGSNGDGIFCNGFEG
jgi:hypothetical protein